MRPYLLLFLLSILTTALSAQSAIIRGNVYDNDNGDPIAFGTIQLTGANGLNKGANTNIDGFFSFANLPVGDYKLIASYIGYETIEFDINIAVENEIAVSYTHLTLPTTPYV